MTGLTNGTGYTFTVHATNSLGRLGGIGRVRLGHPGCSARRTDRGIGNGR